MLYYLLEAVVIIAVCVAGCFFAFSNYKKNIETTIGNAEDKAREIVDEALKMAETKRLKRKKPPLLQGKKSLQNNRQLLQD